MDIQSSMMIILRRVLEDVSTEEEWKRMLGQ